LEANKHKRSRVQKRFGEILTEMEAIERLKAEEEVRKTKRKKPVGKKLTAKARKTKYDEYCLTCQKKNPPSNFIKSNKK